MTNFENKLSGIKSVSQKRMMCVYVYKSQSGIGERSGEYYRDRHKLGHTET